MKIMVENRKERKRSKGIDWIIMPLSAELRPLMILQAWEHVTLRPKMFLSFAPRSSYAYHEGD
jgi:hypothetical protein